MASLNDIFPGENGRLLMIMVMLKLRSPELMVRRRDDELDPELAAELLGALHGVVQSREVRRPRL